MVEFTLFPKLCTELRLKIIKFALYQPRVVELSQGGAPLGYSPRLTTGIPALFHVNRETRDEAIKVFGLEKDENGNLELKPQVLINYVADTVLVTGGDYIHLPGLGKAGRAKIESLAIYQDFWCAMVHSTFGGFHEITCPELIANLKELVVLAVPEYDKSRVQPAETINIIPFFKRRIWAKDYQGPEEAKLLWEHMSGKLTVEYESRIGRTREEHRGWATIQENIGKEWKKVCEDEGIKPKGEVKVSRGVVDKESLRGGLMVFAKEEAH